MSDDPFGRQPQPVTVQLIGSAPQDVCYWLKHLKQSAEFKGCSVQVLHNANDGFAGFKIFPRAVND